MAIEVLHMLLSYLILNPEEEIGVSPESIQTFIETLRCDFPRERVPVVLAPLLYREQQDITEDRQVDILSHDYITRLSRLQIIFVYVFSSFFSHVAP